MRGDNTVRMRSSILVILLVCTTSVFAAPKRRASSPDRCTEIVTPATLSFPSSGGQAAVSVSVKGGCPLSPLADASWITTGVSGAIVTVTAAPNPSTTARTALVHLRSSVVVVTQDATSNLLTNGSFDTNLNGWSELYETASGVVSWSNGTAAITSTQPGGGYQLVQCVRINPLTKYELGANAFIAAGQSSGSVNLAYFEYPNTNCNVAQNSHAYKVVSAAGPAGSWFALDVQWTTASDSQSVLVIIGAGGSPAPPFTANFDDVFLRLRQ